MTNSWSKCCQISVIIVEPSGDKALTCSIKYRRRAPVRTTCLPCATWLKNQYQIKVNAFSLSTSFRSRKKTILGWRLMLQNLRSFVCCAKIVTPPPPSWKSDFKECIASCSDCRVFTLYCPADPVYFLCLYHCCSCELLNAVRILTEDLPSSVYEPSPNTS